MAEDIRALVERARSGDREAFGRLVRSLQGRVYATAFRMTGNHHDASDVAQEAFIRAYRGLSGYGGRAEFFSWLYRIVINVSLNHRRRSQRRPTVSIDDVQLPPTATPTGSDPAAELAAKRRFAEMAAAIADLPESMRATVVLVLLEGLSYREAGEILECSEGTIAWRIHEGRKRLRAALGEQTAGAAS